MKGATATETALKDTLHGRTLMALASVVKRIRYPQSGHSNQVCVPIPLIVSNLDFGRFIGAPCPRNRGNM